MERERLNNQISLSLDLSLSRARALSLRLSLPAIERERLNSQCLHDARDICSARNAKYTVPAAEAAVLGRPADAPHTLTHPSRPPDASPPLNVQSESTGPACASAAPFASVFALWY
jgi:hypothetical protein